MMLIREFYFKAAVKIWKQSNKNWRSYRYGSKNMVSRKTHL